MNGAIRRLIIGKKLDRYHKCTCHCGTSFPRYRGRASYPYNPIKKCGPCFWCGR